MNKRLVWAVNILLAITLVLSVFTDRIPQVRYEKGTFEVSQINLLKNEVIDLKNDISNFEKANSILEKINFSLQEENASLPTLAQTMAESIYHERHQRELNAKLTSFAKYEQPSIPELIEFYGDAVVTVSISEVSEREYLLEIGNHITYFHGNIAIFEYVEKCGLTRERNLFFQQKSIELDIQVDKTELWDYFNSNDVLAIYPPMPQLTDLDKEVNKLWEVYLEKRSNHAVWTSTKRLDYDLNTPFSKMDAMLDYNHLLPIEYQMEFPEGFRWEEECGNNYSSGSDQDFFHFMYDYGSEADNSSNPGIKITGATNPETNEPPSRAATCDDFRKFFGKDVIITTGDGPETFDYGWLLQGETIFNHPIYVNGLAIPGGATMQRVLNPISEMLSIPEGISCSP